MTEPIIISMPVCITRKYEQPCLELRKIITDLDLLKYILSCAFHERTITILPMFPNKMKSLNSMQEKGIIYFDKKEKKYFFNV